jgi:hypothetical protein
MLSRGVTAKSKITTHLKHVVLRDRIIFCVLLVAMCEKEDILLYALHQRIVIDKIVVLELGV